MSDRFQACLAETLKWEGGYSNDAHDPGGPTMHGIIQREYDAYRAHKGLPKQSVRNIAPAEEQEIYRNSYWNAVNGDQLPPGLDLCLFDFAVNSGPGRAIKKLQGCLSLLPDGHLGATTMASICSCDGPAVINDYMAVRVAYLKSLKGWRYFGKGWADRCRGVRLTASLMAKNIPPAAVVIPDQPAPHVDPDTQSQSQGKTPREDPAPLHPAIPATVGGGAAIAATQIPVPDVAAATGLDLQSVLSMAGTLASAAGEHWQVIALAGGAWAFITYGVPYLHARMS